MQDYGAEICTTDFKGLWLRFWPLHNKEPNFIQIYFQAFQSSLLLNKWSNKRLLVVWGAASWYPLSVVCCNIWIIDGDWSCSSFSASYFTMLSPAWIVQPIRAQCSSFSQSEQRPASHDLKEANQWTALRLSRTWQAWDKSLVSRTVWFRVISFNLLEDGNLEQFMLLKPVRIYNNVTPHSTPLFPYETSAQNGYNCNHIFWHAILFPFIEILWQLKC